MTLYMFNICVVFGLDVKYFDLLSKNLTFAVIVLWSFRESYKIHHDHRQSESSRMITIEKPNLCRGETMEDIRVNDYT